MKVVKHQDTRIEMQLSAQDILQLLRASVVGVPDNATVTFMVPSGGDWSGMTVSIDEYPITVFWTVREDV